MLETQVNGIWLMAKTTKSLPNGLEGIVAKKKDSTYEQGARSGAWLKIKQVQTCDRFIFGFTDGEGSKASTFEALVPFRTGVSNGGEDGKDTNGIH